jgi:hypothetical protein
MEWLVPLIPIIVAVLRALVPVLLAPSRPTAEESQRSPELRKRLQRRVRETWG